MTGKQAKDALRAILKRDQAAAELSLADHLLANAIVDHVQDAYEPSGQASGLLRLAFALQELYELMREDDGSRSVEAKA